MAYTKDEALAVICAFLEKIRQELPIEREYLPIVRDIKREGVEITPRGKGNFIAAARSRRFVHVSKSLRASKSMSKSKSSKVRV